MGSSVIGRAARPFIAAALFALGAERACAQPTFSLEVLPEVVTTGTRCQALVTNVRPRSQLRLFASLSLGSSRVGPFATPCGDVGFELRLAGTVKHLRVADTVADDGGGAVMRFKLPGRLPPRYNGVKVYFQAAAAAAVDDGSGGCTVRTATSNLDCSTIRLDVN